MKCSYKKYKMKQNEKQNNKKQMKNKVDFYFFLFGYIREKAEKTRASKGKFPVIFHSKGRRSGGGLCKQHKNVPSYGLPSPNNPHKYLLLVACVRDTL